MDPSEAAILLVDDERSVLRLMQIYLSKVGYKVSSAANATDALAIFRSEQGKFDLVVADLTLPDGSGDDMAREMVAENPDLRVLICSGYPHSLEGLPQKLRSRFGVLQKPFMPDTLAKTIAGLLARATN